MSDEVIAALEALYAQIPDVECRGQCQNACGPVDASDAERTRIRERGVDLPFTAERSEAWAADRRVLPDGRSLVCPALGLMGQCKVYDVRPLVCRAFGAAASMPCEHGCRPKRYLSDAEMFALIIAAYRVGGSPLAGVLDVIEELYRQPRVAPVFARFIRGDTSAKPELEEIVRRSRLNARSREPAGISGDPHHRGMDRVHCHDEAQSTDRRGERHQEPGAPH